MAVALKEQIKTAILALRTDLDKRIGDTDAIFTTVAATPTSSEKVQQLLAAAKKILGEEVIILPQFTLTEDQGNEWQNSFNSSDQMLNFLKNDLQTAFPVDDWLYGTARIDHSSLYILFAGAKVENLVILTT